MPTVAGHDPVLVPETIGRAGSAVPEPAPGRFSHRALPTWAAIMVSIIGAIALAIGFAVVLVACSGSAESPEDAASVNPTAAITTEPVGSVPTPSQVAVTATPAPTADGAATATAVALPPDPSISYAAEPLRLRGIGLIDFGMTVEVAERVTGGIIEPLDESLVDGCVLAQFQNDSTGPKFMVFFEEGEFNIGIIVRADLVPGNTTRSGITIGATKGDVLAAYGDRIQVSPHKYTFDEGGEYLTFVPADEADSGYRLIMETLNDQVTEIRAGLIPAVELVETCA